MTRFAQDCCRMRPLRPLTDRILAGLPGPMPFWFVVWVSIPWMNAGANLLLLDDESRSAVWDRSSWVVALNYAALSLAMVVTLWGTRRIARRLERLDREIADVVETHARTSFRDVDLVAPPLLGAIALASAFGVSTLIEAGFGPAVLRAATWLALGVAMCTFLWTFVALQLGLDRLGRARLDLHRASLAPDLGLRPIGDVAFLGLWLLLAWLVPVVWTGIPDAVGFVIGGVVLAAALAVFVLSLRRLHRRMVEVRDSELAIARRLYAEAYEPLRETPTLATLGEQQSLLSAADALEKRARAIQAWPIDEATIARIATIVTSVIAVTVARLLLDPFGL
jgi:hypothetical protein